MAEEGKEHHEHHEHEKAHEHHESKEEHHNHEKKEEHHNHEKKEEHHEHEKAHEHHEKPETHEKHEHEQPGEKKELRDSRVSTLVLTLAGVAMGFASSVLKSYSLSNYITLTLGLLALVVLLGAVQKAFKRKVKFFLSGVFAYLLVWLVFWIFLFNM